MTDPSQIATWMAEPPPPPPVPLIEQSGLLEGTRCISCRSFAVRFRGGDKFCRRAGASVDQDTVACDHFVVRPGTHYDLPRIEISALGDRLERASHRMVRAFQVYRAKTHARRIEENRERRAARGYVYFVECQGMTKIGFSAKHPDRRRRELQTSNPFPIELWAYARGDETLERALHAKYRAQHTLREWFKLETEHRIELAKLARKTGGAVKRNKFKEICAHG